MSLVPRSSTGSASKLVDSGVVSDFLQAVFESESFKLVLLCRGFTLVTRCMLLVLWPKSAGKIVLFLVNKRRKKKMVLLLFPIIF